MENLSSATAVHLLTLVEFLAIAIYSELGVSKVLIAPSQLFCVSTPGWFSLRRLVCCLHYLIYMPVMFMLSYVFN